MKRKNWLILPIATMLAITSGMSQNISISFGPNLNSSKIVDYDPEISSFNRPESFYTFPGYSFSIKNTFNENKLNFGIGLSQEYIKYGVYLPYRFPGDIMTTSKLKIMNTSFKLGLQGIVGYRINDLEIGFNFGYDISLTNNTKGHFELGYDKGKTMDFTTKEYSTGTGPSFSLLIEKHFSKSAIGLKGTYKHYKQIYYDDIFLHNWTITPIMYGVYFEYNL